MARAMEVDGEPVRNLFTLHKDLVHVNVGSFGTVPREVLDERKRFLDEAEEEPDLWCRITFLKHFNTAADQIAALYKAPPEQVTFVTNATTGVQCVLNSLAFQAGDSILVTSLTYGTLTSHAKWLAEKVGATVHVFEVEFPYTHDSIVRQYTEELSKLQGKLKVALIDHISSTGALLFPIERLIPLCKKFGVLSLIDGAHAPGQLLSSEMDLSQLQPDFYIANIHKWAFAPRACGFLYAAKAFLDILRPQITSWLVDESFRHRFAFLGAGDASNVACVPTALRFIERLGGEMAIRNFVVPLLRQGVDLITEALGTERLCEEQFSAPYMATVYLGPEFDARNDLMTAWRGTRFQDKLYLYLRENLRMATNMLITINGALTLRITAHVFNTLEDYRLLAEALLKMREDIQTLTVEEAIGENTNLGK